MNYGPRISRPYEDISGGLSEWSDISERFLVCQHDPDQGCKKTHVHIGIWGVNVKDEALKRIFVKKTGLKLCGNADWAWEHKRNQYEECQITPYDIEQQDIDNDALMYCEAFRYIRYMIKGDLTRVKMVKNIPTEVLKEAAESWSSSPAKSKELPVTIIEKRVKPPPYQQEVIADAAAEWHKYKRTCRDTGELANETQVVEFVCNAMRKCSKGVNPHMVRDLGYAVLYDDLEYRDLILAKCRKFF